MYGIIIIPSAQYFLILHFITEFRMLSTESCRPATADETNAFYLHGWTLFEELNHDRSALESTTWQNAAGDATAVSTTLRGEENKIALASNKLESTIKGLHQSAKYRGLVNTDLVPLLKMKMMNQGNQTAVLSVSVGEKELQSVKNVLQGWDLFDVLRWLVSPSHASRSTLCDNPLAMWLIVDWHRRCYPTEEVFESEQNWNSHLAKFICSALHGEAEQCRALLGYLEKDISELLGEESTSLDAFTTFLRIGEHLSISPIRSMSATFPDGIPKTDPLQPDSLKKADLYCSHIEDLILWQNKGKNMHSDLMSLEASLHDDEFIAGSSNKENREQFAQCFSALFKVLEAVSGDSNAMITVINEMSLDVYWWLCGYLLYINGTKRDLTPRSVHKALTTMRPQLQCGCDTEDTSLHRLLDVVLSQGCESSLSAANVQLLFDALQTYVKEDKTGIEPEPMTQPKEASENLPPNLPSWYFWIRAHWINALIDPVAPKTCERSRLHDIAITEFAHSIPSASCGVAFDYLSLAPTIDCRKELTARVDNWSLETTRNSCVMDSIRNAELFVQRLHYGWKSTSERQLAVRQRYRKFLGERHEKWEAVVRIGDLTVDVLSDRIPRAAVEALLQGSIDPFSLVTVEEYVVSLARTTYTCEARTLADKKILGILHVLNAAFSKGSPLNEAEDSVHDKNWDIRVGGYRRLSETCKHLPKSVITYLSNVLPNQAGTHLENIGRAVSLFLIPKVSFDGMHLSVRTILQYCQNLYTIRMLLRQRSSVAPLGNEESSAANQPDTSEEAASGDVSHNNLSGMLVESVQQLLFSSCLCSRIAQTLIRELISCASYSDTKEAAELHRLLKRKVFSLQSQGILVEESLLEVLKHF